MANRAASICVLLAVVLIGYWGVWEFGFVGYDDPDYLASNPVVQRGLSADGLKWAFSTNHAANWHPLTWISLQVQVSLFGAGSGAAHAVNLFLHALASVLLFLFLSAATRRELPSLAVAILFAVHPAHVESVAWIAERKDVLSATFGFASLWAWVRYARSQRRSDYLACALLLALGLLAKQMLVTWPLLFMLLNRWPLERTAAWKLQLREQLPFLAICFTAGLATVWAQSAGGALATTYEISLPARLANAAVSIWSYLRMLFWPAQLSVLYPHPYLTPALGGIPAWKLGLGAAGILVTAAAYRRMPAALQFGLIWYVVTLLPVLGIVQVGPQSHADRYSYIPFVGPFLALAWALRGPQWAQFTSVGLVTLACILGTRMQLPAWQDDEELYKQAMANTQHNWLAAGNLSSYYLSRGRGEDAERLLREGLESKPDAAMLHYNLGNLHLGRNEPEAARLRFTEALRWDPEHYNALNNLAEIHSRSGDYALAVPLYRRAHELHPAEQDFELNLADALRRTGQRDEARKHVEAVLQKSSCHSRAYDILARMDFDFDIAQATAHARRAVECSGGTDPVVLETLAHCERRGGRLGRAEDAARRALRLAEPLRQTDRVSRLRAFLADISDP